MHPWYNVRMSGFRNNLFTTCMQGISEVYLLGLSLVFVLSLGGLLGVLIVEHGFVQSSAFFYLLWVGGFVVGLFQVWGIISYTLIAFQVIALFHVDSKRWLILLSLLLTQTGETTRMLLNYHDHSPWLHAIALFGVILIPILCATAYYYLDRESIIEQAPYTDCRSCGYNLIGTLEDNRAECPECGQPITDYQRIQSTLDQRKQLE